MAINKIIIENVKGTSVQQDLIGADIFVGPNGIGKSTRIEALGTALLGYVPGAGKTPSETFKLSSDSNEMKVGLELDDFNFIRTFSRNERKKKSTGETEIGYSESVNISPSKGERTNTKKKARIEQEVGSFPVMLDFGQFINLSDSKRRDFIYSLSSSDSSWDKERLRQFLEDELLTTETEINAPDHYETLQEIIDESLEQFPDSFSFEDGLTALSDYVDDQVKYWNKNKKDTEGAVRSLADLKNQERETDRNARQNKEDLAKFREKYLELKEQLARDKVKKQAHDKKMARIEELKTGIDNLKGTPKHSNEEFEKQISKLQEQIKYVPESKSADYMQKADELSKQSEQAKQESWNLKSEYQKLESRRDQIQSTVDTINENKGVCVIQKQISCHKDFTPYVEHATKQITELERHMNELESQGIQKQEEAKKLQDEAQKWRLEAQKDNNDFRDVVNFNKQITDQINALKEEIAANERKNENLQNNIDQLETELNKLESEPVDAIAPLDVLEKQQASILEQINELEEKVQEQEKVKNKIQTLRQTMFESKKATLKADSYKDIKEKLGSKGVRGLIVKEQLNPIKKDIEANLKEMGINHEVFFETTSASGQEVFQFGWIKEGQSTNFDSLSTGEKLIYLIAFMVTILERANPPLKVLALDNIENLDKRNFKNALEGLEKLSNKLDNIILAGVVDVPDVDGWKVWNLAAGGEKEHAIA
ncbi:AAA family ATPase [Virgibacillus sp. Bac330]|uniref:AAA family ATPase n=1 Tax=Virgibacillus sp. Bac330 TaxID=2419841 RepID=UPI000EF471E1|nr:AAA family ATPase [Virgibacillus sp. Bac330]